MKNKIKSKVIVPHHSKCRIREWSGIITGKLYGNYAANEEAKRGKHHLWYKVSCNDPQCKGIKAVHSSVLADA
jgi:predicted RNA-binding protein with PUA-like domain